MTTDEKVEALIRQVTELPDEAQTELIETLVEIHSEHLSVYHLDEEERAALARSAEDERLGRFASEQEIGEVFARYRA
jgi:hypothetical protein